MFRVSVYLWCWKRFSVLTVPATFLTFYCFLLVSAKNTNMSVVLSISCELMDILKQSFQEILIPATNEVLIKLVLLSLGKILRSDLVFGSS